jgi:RNA polymerase sigma-70 factor (ECF subfamily)
LYTNADVDCVTTAPKNRRIHAVSDKDHRPGERAEWANTTSIQMVEGASGGNRDSWERLVRLYAPLVLHWCRRRLRGSLSQDAPDLVQNVFMTVSEKIATFTRHGRGAFHGWLHQIFERKMKEYWREYWRHHRNVIIEPTKLDCLLAPKDSSDPDGGLVIILRGLLELIRPEFEHRIFQAFLKVAVDGRPAKDVAEELGMTRNHVDQAKFKVRKRLEEEFEALGLPVNKTKIAAGACVAGNRSEVTS